MDHSHGVSISPAYGRGLIGLRLVLPSPIGMAGTLSRPLMPYHSRELGEMAAGRAGLEHAAVAQAVAADVADDRVVVQGIVEETRGASHRASPFRFRCTFDLMA